MFSFDQLFFFQKKSWYSILLFCLYGQAVRPGLIYTSWAVRPEMCTGKAPSGLDQFKMKSTCEAGGFHILVHRTRVLWCSVFKPKLRFGVKVKSFHCEFTVRCKHLTVVTNAPQRIPCGALEFAMEVLHMATHNATVVVICCGASGVPPVVHHFSSITSNLCHNRTDCGLWSAAYFFLLHQVYTWCKIAAGVPPAANMLHWLRQCSNTTIGVPPIVEPLLLRSKTI